MRVVYLVGRCCLGFIRVEARSRFGFFEVKFIGRIKTLSTHSQFSRQVYVYSRGTMKPIVVCPGVPIGSLCLFAHFSNSKCPALYANEGVFVSHGQPFARSMHSRDTLTLNTIELCPTVSPSDVPI